MKALVVYDTNHGNTQEIAEEIAHALGGSISAVSVEKVKKNDLSGLDLFILGSPVIGSQPTEKMAKFLDGLSKDQLKGTKAAAFDTRMKPFFFTNAINKIETKLKNAGADVLDKEKFWVKGAKGPLLKDELERAKKWAGGLQLKLSGH